MIAMIDHVCWSFIFINAIGVTDFFFVRDEKLGRHLASVFFKLFWTNLTLVLFWGISATLSAVVMQLQYFHSQFLVTDFLPAVICSSASNFWSYFGILPIPMIVAAFYILKFVIQLLNFNPQISIWEVLLLCARPVSIETAERLVASRVDEMSEDQYMESLPNLWLTPSLPTDYIKYLPVWQHRGWNRRQRRNSFPRVANSMTKLGLFGRKILRWLCGRFRADNRSERVLVRNYPQWIIPDSNCAICLEEYCQKILICGLPCGHHYHRDCISVWLYREQHYCPICRRPAYETSSF